MTWWAIQSDRLVADLADWLALHRAPGVGPRTFRRLLERYGSPRAVLETAAAEGAASGIEAPALDYLRHPDWERVERDLRWLEEAGGEVVPLDDPGYPPLLRQIADAPPLLYILGDAAVLCRPQLAMVGSRNPTPAGTDNARNFAYSLTLAGLTITSGLALGIDAASHLGALSAGGMTVAVAGTGVDVVYPSSHAKLAQDIASRGAIVSEFPLGTAPVPGNFPRRNRIIAGLCVGVLVVEAARHSGSLITARFAVEGGREVFAIPGSIHNPLARGCHALIRQGAKLVETARDIAEELEGFLAQAVTEIASCSGNDAADLPVECQELMKHLTFDPSPVDELVERSGLTAEAVSSMLLMLELQGHVSSMAGGLYARRGKRA
jgi:DNA processing protein